MRLVQHRYSMIIVIFMGSCLWGGLVAGATKTPPAPLDRRILVTAVDVTKTQVTIETMSTKGKAVFDLDVFTINYFPQRDGKDHRY